LAWQIEVSAAASRQLAKLDRAAAKRITAFLRERIMGTEDPRNNGKALVGTHAGLWRYRVGDYRLICDIQDGRLIVLVLEVGHHKDIYD
jgi:mRNA interferase RelE/StbE